LAALTSGPEKIIPGVTGSKELGSGKICYFLSYKKK